MDDDDYDYDYDLEDEECTTCWGEGFILTCCDDICVGQGYCMHGDDEEPCPDCEG